MKKIFQLSVFAGVLLFVASCDPITNEVYYKFGDTMIRRTDQSNKTTFYYMQDSVAVDTVWVKYSGLTNSWFSARMFFLEDGSILIAGDVFKRKRKIPYKFKFDDPDCPPFYKKRIMYGKVHVNSTGEFRRFEDSLMRQGRAYDIVLADPQTEKDLFNEDNPNTKVRVFYYPK